jgi:hypothetical protein
MSGKKFAAEKQAPNFAGARKRFSGFQRNPPTLHLAVGQGL